MHIYIRLSVMLLVYIVSIYAYASMCDAWAFYKRLRTEYERLLLLRQMSTMSTSHEACVDFNLWSWHLTKSKCSAWRFKKRTYFWQLTVLEQKILIFPLVGKKCYFYSKNINYNTIRSGNYLHIHMTKFLKICFIRLSLHRHILSLYYYTRTIKQSVCSITCFTVFTPK